jgi:hypothetical protein
MLTNLKNTRWIILLPIGMVLILMLAAFMQDCEGCEDDCEDCPTPTPTAEEESVIEGDTSEREGNVVTPNFELPNKGDDVLPLEGLEGDKPLPEEVQTYETDELIQQYGDEAKGQPEDIDPITDGTKREIDPSVSESEYGRLVFTITPDAITLTDSVVLDGALLPVESIMGDILFIIFQDERPIFVGTFPDPLLAIGFPQDNEGHSYSQLEESSFVISVPNELIDRDVRASSRIEFYRLDPSLSSETPVTVENVRILIETSELIAEIDNEALLNVFSSEETGD